MDRAFAGRLATSFTMSEKPVEHFRELYARIGPRWSPAAEAFLNAADRADDGNAYSLNRPTGAIIDRWRAGFTTAEIESRRRILDAFEIPDCAGFGSNVPFLEWGCSSPGAAAQS